MSATETETETEREIGERIVSENEVIKLSHFETSTSKQQGTYARGCYGRRRGGLTSFGMPTKLGPGCILRALMLGFILTTSLSLTE